MPQDAFWVAVTALLGVIATWLRAEYQNWKIRNDLKQYLCGKAPTCPDKVNIPTDTSS